MVFLNDFNQYVNDWNVSNVNNTRATFDACYYFNQPLDKWDVSNVTDMEITFKDATSFMQEIRTWNMNPNVTTKNMFSGATKMIDVYQYSNDWSITPPLTWFTAPSENYDNNIGSIQISTIGDVAQNLTVQNMLDTTGNSYQSIANQFDEDGNVIMPTESGEAKYQKPIEINPENTLIFSRGLGTFGYMEMEDKLRVMKNSKV